MSKLAGRPYDESVGVESRALMDRLRQTDSIPKRDADQLCYEFDKYRQQIKRSGAAPERRVRTQERKNDVKTSSSGYKIDVRAPNHICPIRKPSCTGCGWIDSTQRLIHPRPAIGATAKSGKAP